jgi:hypothetical protein
MNHREFNRLAAAAALFLAFGGPAMGGPPQRTIGAPDGTFYRVVSSREIIRPAVQCGFNDLGLARGGVFLEETLKCETYARGRLVKTEIKKRYRFLRCLPD